MPNDPTLSLAADGRLRLAFPCGQTLCFTASEDGLRAIQSVLVARATSPGPPKIGTPGLPVQSMVDEMLRQRRSERVRERTGVQLDLSGIDL